MTDDGLYRSLDQANPLPGIERWRLAIPPGIAWPSEPSEWAGALVLIEQGSLDVECVAGGTERFLSGDLLALGWLPIRTLRNRGTEEVLLLAVRRTDRGEKDEYLRVARAVSPTMGAATLPPREVQE